MTVEGLAGTDPGAVAGAGEHWWPSLADPGTRIVPVGGAHGVVIGQPHPRLRGHVLSYAGIDGADVAVATVQRVPPECAVMLTIWLSGACRGRLFTARCPAAVPALGVAGLYDRFYRIGPGITGAAVLVALAPPSAFALFGVGMGELANTHLPLADLVGRRAAVLAEQLALCPTWRARFTVLDRTLTRWLSAGPVPDGTLVRAWQRIATSRGGTGIGRIADELGCSRRHLEKKFAEQVGLSPKTVARVWRFQHAAHLLLAAPGRPWADIAHACGYTDQAHLNRDFRLLAGRTPTQLLDARPHP
ncbi:AraC family transcriptional regulator [Streptantibioticus cattleyicolor]|uniref:Helix-turn-helix, AraC domain protein n=1 Tax=Streptantibioticus cattleyicolor (strain ATCC 35852 / DSM 46488 / JCM 4925 / NBRC 14057 / NRRL 8057) TaxID=1003195 RepID=F8JLT9_STREN|nr:helix-turn-helix domain-containing protein [Streptantibioticus cattleyicolor]AEW99475.1 Helix-turn-helix, AraC domain protein [Streptantibioticus cattleyicolor NRRL 8057 = DSM 46488]CCB71483.1 putative Transcriptional regulator [Streptantibioticus cattleyicolor NRRL 8057 = DSM 46488]